MDLTYNLQVVSGCNYLPICKGELANPGPGITTDWFWDKQDLTDRMKPVGDLNKDISVEPEDVGGISWVGGIAVQPDRFRLNQRTRRVSSDC